MMPVILPVVSCATTRKQQSDTSAKEKAITFQVCMDSFTPKKSNQLQQDRAVKLFNFLIGYHGLRPKKGAVIFLVRYIRQLTGQCFWSGK